MPRPNKGPRLELNDFGIYEIRWSEAGRSKRVSTRAGNLAEAQRFLGGWLLEAERAKSDAWTVSQALDYYTAEWLDADKTALPENDKQRMSHLRSHFGDTLIPDIDASDVNEYVRRRKSGKLGRRKVVDSTVRRELVILIAALNFCADQKKYSKKDVPTIPLPAESEPRDLWLIDEELDLLQAAAFKPLSKRQARGYRFVAIARYAAARKHAIERLTWFQVDLARGMIDFRQRGERRTKKRKTVVPIAGALMPILKKAHAEKINEFVLDHPGAIRKAFETAVAKAARAADRKAADARAGGALEDALRWEASARRLRQATPHTLRHSWATLAAQRGVPLYDIAGVLGDTLATVEKHYAKHCPNHLRSAVNAHRPEQQQKESDQ